MGYDQFTHVEKDVVHSLNDATVYEGNASVEIPASSTANGEILTQSITDAPTEAQIITHVNEIKYADNHSVAGIFRYQDANNFYVLGLIANPSSTVYLGKVSGGAYTQIATKSQSNSWGNNTTWEDMKLSCWVDAAGDLRFRMEWDQTADGTYQQVASDFTIANPEFSTGGGVGVGNSTDLSRTPLYDATEIYY